MKSDIALDKETQQLFVQRILIHYNMFHITLTHTHTHTDLNIISNADRRSCSMGFLLVSVLPATVCSEPNVNASGRLWFMGLCWSHSAFPCIIYMKLSLFLCIHKHRSQTSRDQWMTEIKYLCWSWSTWGGSRGRGAPQGRLPAAWLPEGSEMSSIRDNRRRDGNVCCSNLER